MSRIALGRVDDSRRFWIVKQPIYEGQSVMHPVTFTLVGDREVVQSVKQHMISLIGRAQGQMIIIPTPFPGDERCFQLMIPVQKVHLLFGEGGLKIRKIQTLSKVKIIMMDDIPETVEEKPVWIYGEDSCVLVARLRISLLLNPQT
ncbi:uncharacterized protein LOC129233738 [Uloborus diversus]|uniref:uncharacterized protein LOC129233738 n=1 Tax=Uloborus diversus TaxID=327109 RepID=UPI002409CCF1|nr:uncharacterized protein LOC129233738 [Uloborus diversus]